MFRSFLSCLAVLAISTFANAETPTKSNWVAGLDRYAGQFHIFTEGNNEPVTQFQSHWVVSNKVFEYSSFSIGDAPNSRGVGFCFWNEEENRPEFNEIEYGGDGRLVYEGACIDVTKTTMTWIVTSWSKDDGVINKKKMIDTHNSDGLDRSIEHLSGKEEETKIVKWTRVKKRKSDHPGN
jgi:hypothetical protein